MCRGFRVTLTNVRSISKSFPRKVDYFNHLYFSVCPTVPLSVVARSLASPIKRTELILQSPLFIEGHIVINYFSEAGRCVKCELTCFICCLSTLAPPFDSCTMVPWWGRMTFFALGQPWGMLPLKNKTWFYSLVNCVSRR